MYIASSSTIRVYGGLRRSGVLFVPSPGLKRCITRGLPRGAFTFCGNKYPERVIIDTGSMRGTHTTRSSTLFLMRPRYHRRMMRRTSCMNSAAKVVRFTGGSRRGRFVVKARGDVMRRLRFRYPSGGFCPITMRLAYVGVGIAALVSVCGYLGKRNKRRVFLPRGVVRNTKEYVREVIRLNN